MSFIHSSYHFTLQSYEPTNACLTPHDSCKQAALSKNVLLDTCVCLAATITGLHVQLSMSQTYLRTPYSVLRHHSINTWYWKRMAVWNAVMNVAVVRIGWKVKQENHHPRLALKTVAYKVKRKQSLCRWNEMLEISHTLPAAVFPWASSDLLQRTQSPGPYQTLSLPIFVSKE